jgi:hypothetical protein
MKYVLAQFQDSVAFLLFSERFDHSSVFHWLYEIDPKVSLASAGKLYIEPCDCYPGEHYVSVNPGSVTLSLHMANPADFAQHAALVQPFLTDPIRFQYHAHTNTLIYSSTPAAPYVFSKTGSPITLTFAYTPVKDNSCPRAKVTLSAVDYETEFFFWQNFRRC